jgi:hypothetical protein
MNARFFRRICRLNRSALIAGVLVGMTLLIPQRSRVTGAQQASTRTDPLASWNDGAANQAMDKFQAEVKTWLETAKDPRWKRPFTDLTYVPMLELTKYLGANGYKTYIVTGGGQDFVRVYSEKVYGVPPEQVIGTAGGTKFMYDEGGKPYLMKDPKLLLNDNNAEKPEGIHLMIGRRPYAAFGNSTGDRQMLEYTKAGDGARLAMLVLHDDARREYAYGPAQGLPDTKVGTFTTALYEEAKQSGFRGRGISVFAPDKPEVGPGARRKHYEMFLQAIPDTRGEVIWSRRMDSNHRPADYEIWARLCRWTQVDNSLGKSFAGVN